MEYDGSSSRFVRDKVPLSAINILPQPRKTFDDIDILAQDIARHGLTYEPLVAPLNKNDCKNYLQYINEIRVLNCTIEDLVPMDYQGERIFLILIDGERRTRACRWLLVNSCIDCKEEDYKDGCYENHFGDSLIDTRLCFGISPSEAVDRQYSANLHVKVPPFEEAEDLASLFKFRKRLNSKYTLSEFSRTVGRSPRTLQRALKFNELPDIIKQAVKNKYTTDRRFEDGVIQNQIREFNGLNPSLDNLEMSYGTAIEMYRLQERGLSEPELKEWAIRAMVGNCTVPQFRQMIDEYLSVLDNGQMDLWSLLDDSAKRLIQKPGHRLVIEKHMIQILHSQLYYWKRVLELAEAGLIDLGDLPFDPHNPKYSVLSPRNMLKKLMQIEANTLPYLWNRVPNANHTEQVLNSDF